MNNNKVRDESQIVSEGYVFEVGSLRDELEDVSDARDPRGKRWPAVIVLLFAILAKLGGEDTLTGIAQWVNLRIGWLCQTLQLKPRSNRKGEQSGPHATSYSRILGHAIDVNQLEQVIHRFIRRQSRVGLAIQITLDGKKMRGTISRDNPTGVYLLGVFLPQVGLVLLQARIQADQNELSVAPQVLACLDLQGKIVTADAIFTQRALSIQIVAGGGDYLWKVKNNQPRLLVDIQLLFQRQAPQRSWNVPKFDMRQATQPDIGHGRIERRTLRASSDLRDYVNWPYAQQVFRYEYHYHELSTGKRGRSITYGITSLSAREASAQQLLQLTRGHWGIENGLHYRRDVTLHEDAGHWRFGHLAQVMAALNNLVVSCLLPMGNNLPALRRTINAQPQRALSLLLNAQA